jgi:hypothetical protein
MTNDEGGTDNEEFRTSAVLDRVNTTWEGLMGTTFSCVQCHSHPYDPFRHDEYYSFLAYFNNTRDEDQYPSEYPYLRIYDDRDKEQVNKITEWVKQHGTEKDADEYEQLLRTWQPAVYASTADSIKNGYVDGNNATLKLNNTAYFRLKKMDLEEKDQMIIYFSHKLKGSVMSMHVDSLEAPSIATFAIPPTSKMEFLSITIPKVKGTHDLYFRYNNKSLPVAYSKDPVNLEWFAFTSSFPGKGNPGYDANKKLFWQVISKPVETIPVMVENPDFLQRKTHVFERGNRITLGKEVKARVPNTFSAAMPKNAPADRRGLVMWLTNTKNPLVSRTLVNRFWEQLFGTGIVETLEDMGTQGSLPTHQALLDHYSWKLMTDYKWSMKKLIKEFVMSATYRQDSKVTDEHKATDPYNKYYARGPRLRLHAEQLRDQHLCISGVMNEKMYGPSVMPWQPEGIWNNPYNSEKWENSKNGDQYRRSVYTYIKRTGTYPSLISFDGTSRIVCTPRRIRTNTPLQALVTLNDSVYIDMATHFATRMMKEGGNDAESRITKGYEIMLYKKISPQKLQVLLNLYKQAYDEYKKDESKAIIFTGSDKTDKQVVDKAAMKVVANAMLNLDEVITKN